MRKLLRVYEALDRFVEGDARRDEDGEADGVAGPPRRTIAAKEKGSTHGYRSQGVTCVVDQVGEKSHGTGKDEDHGLHGRGCAEHAETDRHRLDPSPRADDRGVD